MLQRNGKIQKKNIQPKNNLLGNIQTLPLETFRN